MNVASQTSFGKNEPFELQVARGLIPFHSLLNVFGYQVAVGTGAPILVWENNTAYVYPTTATTMLLYSSSASDTDVSVTITGLAGNFEPISETLILTNGTTGVSTAKQYLRINGMVCNDLMHSLPVGNLFLGNAGKTEIYSRINASVNRSQAAIYTVPAGYTFYLTRIDVFSSEAGGGSNYANYQVYTKNNVTGQTFVVLQSPFLGRYEARRVVPFPYTEKTDVQWQVSAGTSTTPVGVVAEGILIRNKAD